MTLAGDQLKEHVLNRVGHGQTIWASDRYDQLDAAGYIAEQLAQTLPAIAITGINRFGKLDRGAFEQRQLETILRNFWFNHFNVDYMPTRPGSNESRSIDHHENVAIAPYVLGRFGDMLQAVAKSPAILLFLDNWFNRKNANNDNFARELMELHTIGVNGGYTEVDIVNVTRIFTGWSLFRTAENTVHFTFNDAWHDKDPKTVLGQDFPAGGGIEEGEELLEMLAQHPAASTFLSYKLCVHFVSETPPASLVSAAAAVFADTDGDLAAVMTTILSRPEFTDATNFRSKVKPPLRWMMSALAATGMVERTQSDGFFVSDLATYARRAGEESYENPSPAGYPDASGFWMSPVGMEQRFIAAGRVAAHNVYRIQARANVDGSDSAETVDAIAAIIAPGGISSSTRTEVLDHLVLAPDLPNLNRIARVTQLLLSSPEFLRY